MFAALEVATGRVTDACYDRHRHEEFLDFLKKVARAYPRPLNEGRGSPPGNTCTTSATFAP